jgi:RNA polymerase sigma factor (sigma-70 family)
MQELDDIALLREYVEHDSGEAFSTLVARHVDKVYSVALRHTGNPHTAEEIAQAVFVILARKARSLSKGVILSGWLYHAARLASLTFVRSEIRRARREQEAYMQTLLNETESDVWPQIAPLLDQAMAGLNEKDRHAIVLRFFDGHSVKEVGAALGTSEDAAKMRLGRAVEKLRSFFLKRGMAVPAAALTEAISTNSVQSAPALLAQSAAAAALAHSASVSASTLTLIQGALKLMAWTKAKTAILAAAAIFLAAGTTTVVVEEIHAARVAAYPDLQGNWEGLMHLDDAGVGAGQLSGTRVVLKLNKVNGRYTASTDWIDLGRKDVPMGRVVYDYPSLQIERNPREIWYLKVDRNSTAMTLKHGIHFIQPDDVVFRRTSSPAEVAERLAEQEFAPRGGSDLQGYWVGAIGTNADAIPVRLKIAEQADGTFRAEGDNPMQGVNGQPLSVTYTRPHVNFSVATGAGMFRGQINADRTEITGAWIQDGQSTPASARRADYQAEHAQDADKDYTFVSKNDLQGHWKGTWIAVFPNNKVPIRFALDIARLPDGTYATTLTSIDQFGQDAPIEPSEFQFNPPNLRMSWKFGGAFEGSMKNGKIVGKWLQGGGAFPLVFERSK